MICSYKVRDVSILPNSSTAMMTAIVTGGTDGILYRLPLTLCEFIPEEIETSTEEASDLGMIVGIIFGCLFLLGLSIGAFVFLFLKRRSFQRRREFFHLSFLIDSKDFEEWAIVYPELQLGKRIGKGAFGDVFAATWRNAECVVKQMSDTEGKNAQRAFVNEANQLK